MSLWHRVHPNFGVASRLGATTGPTSGAFSEKTRRSSNSRDTQGDALERLPRSVLAEIRRHALSRPLDIAIEDSSRPGLDSAWSYRQLWLTSAAIAKRISACGVRSGDSIALALPRGTRHIVCELAAMRLGVTFFPLSIDQPVSRLLRMAVDCSAKVLLADRDIRAAGVRAELDTIDIAPWFEELDGPMVEREPRIDSPHGHQPDAIAYGIFTSGSTGMPKATILRHRGLSNLVAAQREFLRIGEGTRVLQFAAPCFDASISEIFVTLAAGGTLCIASPAELTPGEPLWRTLRDSKIDAVTLPPSILAMLPRGALPRLKTLVVAGEACSAELATHWSIGRRLINAYGPSECTVCATMYDCPEGEQVAPPLGQPIAGAKVQVMVADRQATANEVGELYIGGLGVGAGYVNAPKSCDERFVAIDGEHGSETWFRTGDLVRLDMDGALHFCGRVDDQIKLRGIRVEPTEIQSVLERVEGVRQAIVQPIHQGNPTTIKLAAHLLVDAVTPAHLKQLLSRCRQACAQLLPLTMVPSQYFAQTQWPRTDSGKVARDRLRETAVELVDDNHSSDDSAPRDAIEYAVLEAFRRALHSPKLGMADNFFAAGGDSLVAAHLASEIELLTGQSFSLGMLASYTTPEELAQGLRDQQTNSQRCLVSLRSGSRDRAPLFLVHPGGGNVLCYLPLARALPRGLPCYAFQARGIVGGEKPIETIDEMAANYVQAMRAAQPSGPYYIAGWSFGGFVAYEMARQLAKLGERVAWLGLIDAGLGYCTRILKEISGSESLEMGLRRGADDLEGSAVGFARAMGVFPEGLLGPRLRGYVDVFLANVRALSRWQPRNYDDAVHVLFAPNTAIDRRRWPDREWSRWSKQVIPMPLEGSHLTLMREPDVIRLAEVLSTALDPSASNPPGS
jgi:amino acid adenylation domain-containing protein